MTDKTMLNDTVDIHVSLRSAEETETKTDNDPPLYEYPQLDFSGGWKDLGFAIVFWINAIAVILVGIILGIPTIVSSLNHDTSSQMETTSFDASIKPFAYGLCVAAAVGALASFLSLFILQQCAGQMIKCSFFIIIMMQVLLGVILLFILWPLSLIPATFILFTLIFLSCIRKRISFAEAHLQAGFASLRSHPSVILIALAMIVVEFLWFIFWFLMILGIINFWNNSMTTFFIIVLILLLLFSWYWVAITFGNITHFITACSVGHWWFSDEASRQYTLKTSVKRAFTTNFGTICFGSFFEAFIKAARSCTESNGGKNILACAAHCILLTIEKLVGYLNEWAFIYAALTGQGFVQASRSFIKLFQQRGWTMVINDSLIETTMLILNFAIGLISAAVGGLIMQLITNDSSEKIESIIIIVLISFLIGLLMSTIVTTILKGCVRTVLVCFALNPAALAATHPDHFQALTKVWHQVYPQEFADSGYANKFIEPAAYA
ncbi:unnamed protein product [Rotaria sp. Silwood1]|nr:unnamed protein product [Rotaria sp. Silwood1]